MHRHFAETDSTNEEALRWGRDGAPHFALVTADAQTAGRGRRGRSWNSPPGKGLYLSLLVRPNALQSQLPYLNFAACLAATRAVQKLTGQTCHTKWPNDVLMNGRKIAGVLSEAVWHEGELSFAVIGLGLNVNHAPEDLPPRPIYPASSLLIETGRVWEVADLRDLWMKQFRLVYNRLKSGKADSVRDEFWRRCAQKNQCVKVQSENETVTGLAFGLAQDGSLLLETGNGIHRVLAGDLVQEKV